MKTTSCGLDSPWRTTEAAAMQEKHGARPPLIDFAGDRDLRLAEDVGDLGLAQARGVVFERQLVLGFVDAKAPQSIGVRELAEMAQLLFGQRGL